MPPPGKALAAWALRVQASGRPAAVSGWVSRARSGAECGRCGWDTSQQRGTWLCRRRASRPSIAPPQCSSAGKQHGRRESDPGRTPAFPSSAQMQHRGSSKNIAEVWLGRNHRADRRTGFRSVRRRRHGALHRQIARRIRTNMKASGGSMKKPCIIPRRQAGEAGISGGDDESSDLVAVDVMADHRAAGCRELRSGWRRPANARYAGR